MQSTSAGTVLTHSYTKMFDSLGALPMLQKYYRFILVIIALILGSSSSTFEKEFEFYPVNQHPKTTILVEGQPVFIIQPKDAEKRSPQP